MKGQKADLRASLTFSVTAASSRSRRLNSPLAQTFLAGRSIYLTTGLRRRLEFLKAGATTSGAFCFCYFLSRHRHNICFLKGASNQFHWCPLNLPHVVVRNRTLFSVIPFNGNFTPRRSGNRTKIGLARTPTNAVASFQKSGLFAGHFVRLLFARGYSHCWDRLAGLPGRPTGNRLGTG